MDPQTSLELEEVPCSLCFVFHPQWARRLATRRVFAFFYGMLSIVQGMGFLYIVTTITSVEQHFQLPSETFGIIFSVGEIMVIFAGLIIGLVLGVSSHRPRAIGITLGIMGVGCQLFALPYYLYGSPTPFNSTYSDNDNNSNVLLCKENSTLLLPVLPELPEVPEVDELYSVEQVCRSSLEAPDVSVGGLTALFLLAYTVCNVGAVALYVIGTPFLDDNVQNKDSAMYLAAMCSLRTLGPIFGTLLGSFCLTFYVDPLSPPWFDAHDVRWVGAWWIGYIVMGILSFICAIGIAQFPQRLQSKKLTPAMKMEAAEMEPMNNSEKKEGKQDRNKIITVTSIREMWINLRRILVNCVLWMRILSETFTWFGLEGFMLYLPKYLEHEFHMTSSQAGLWTGCSFIIPSLIGNLIVGYVIMRFRVNARQLALAVVIFKITEAVLMASLMFIRCEESYLLGSGNNYPVCGEKTCDCSSAIISPVCGSDGVSYFSACHAGCAHTNGSFAHSEFYNCTCVMGDEMAVSGACDVGCPQTKVYLAIVAISKLCLSVEIVAGLLFTLRCVEPRDKTLATGFLCAILGIFTFIPCPLIFSAAVDSSCSVWSKQCGRKGACDVYDMDRLRTILHVIPVSLVFIGALWDAMFWHISKGKLSLLEDEEEKPDIIKKKDIK